MFRTVGRQNKNMSNSKRQCMAAWHAYILLYLCRCFWKCVSMELVRPFGSHPNCRWLQPKSVDGIADTDHSMHSAGSCHRPWWNSNNRPTQKNVWPRHIHPQNHDSSQSIGKLQLLTLRSIRSVCGSSKSFSRTLSHTQSIRCFKETNTSKRAIPEPCLNHTESLYVNVSFMLENCTAQPRCPANQDGYPPL